METKHTPGPWHLECDPVKGDQFGRVRYQVTALGKTVTRVYYSSFEGGQTNAEFDARLIAASPRLLSALDALVNWVNKGPYPYANPAEMQEARAAITEATGA